MSRREERMGVMLALVIVTAAVGLFAPGSWHPFLFSAVALFALVGVYEAPAAEDDGTVEDPPPAS
jgi:hypothetical protein